MVEQHPSFIDSKLALLQSRIEEINNKEAARSRRNLLTGSFKEASVIDESSIILNSEDKARQPWEDQIKMLIVAGFHKKLGLSEEDYKNSLPSFQLAPKDIMAYFPIPLLVEPRVKNEYQIRGFDNDFHDNDSINEIKNRSDIVTPKTPYQVWAQDGKKYKKLRVEQVLERFANQPYPPERGLTFQELLALYRARVEIFFEERPKYNNYGFDLCSAGSISKQGQIPTIYHNYFDLQEFGEFQACAFFLEIIPRGGWPSCWDTNKYTGPNNLDSVLRLN